MRSSLRRFGVFVLRLVFFIGATYVGFLILTSGVAQDALYGTHWIHYSTLRNDYYSLYLAALASIAVSSLILFFDKPNRHLAIFGFILILIGIVHLAGPFTFIRERN